MLLPDAFYDLKMHQNAFEAGALPLNPMGSFMAGGRKIGGERDGTVGGKGEGWNG